MKKAVLLSIFLAALLLSACGKEPQIGSEVNREYISDGEVSMEVLQHTQRSATVRFVNQTNGNYLSDILFSVQTELDGKWYGLVNEYKGANVAEAELHRANTESEIEYSWNHMYGDLGEGHYRIVKVLCPEDEWPDGERIYLAAEFFVE